MLQLVFAYVSAIVIGAAAGFLVIGALPSAGGFLIVFAVSGLVVGAMIGPVALTGALIAFSLTLKLRRRPRLRMTIVAVVCGLMAAAPVQYAFAYFKSAHVVPIVVVTLAVGTAIAFTAYHLAQRCFLNMVPASTP